MNQFVRNFILGFGLFLVSGVIKSTQGQSVFDPNDPIVIYNPANPPVEPPFGQVGKWVKRNRLGWNTSSFKAYIYKGVQFRLKWPKNYDASGNTKYPLLVFFHGRGEWGNKYDNEYQLYHGGQKHSTAVDNGSFNGFLLYPQASILQGAWSAQERQFVMELVQQFLIPEVNVDPYRISVNGLSAGGLMCWRVLEQTPKLVAASLPISNATVAFDNIIINNKFTPIWLFQGGKDTDPKPFSSQALKTIADNAGANFTYTEYPNLGHAAWDAAWAEPDYFPFLMRANKTNPWPLYGQTEFCNNGPGSINTTIGVSAGFTQYQWQRNGTIIPGEIQNTLTVTDTGTYSCRIKDGANWSYWSPIPVQIKYKTGTVPPTIKMTELQSYVLPSPDGNTTINLEVPAGYTSYKWERVGSSSTISITNVLNGVGAGSYRVRVTEQAGCAGAYSDPFTVIDADGPNKPDPAINLLAIPLSFTSMKLNWSSNPSAPYPTTHFEIYEATQSGGPYKFVSLVNEDMFSFVREGLKPGTKYYYIIRAINSTAASPVSNEAYATTQKDVNPPTAPQNLRVTGTSRNYVAIAWEESIDDIGMDHYEIFVNGIMSYTTSAKEYTVYGLNYGSSYNFTVKAVDLAGNKSAPSNQVTTQALNKGLNFKHYIGTWDNLPDFDLLTPISTGVVPNVTLANTTQAENYAFLWEGYIRIPSTGDYTFRTRSDDGSKLYLNTTYGYTKPALVDNDGLHSAQNKDASIYLTAGVYPIAITFFQKGGGAEMGISWRKTSGSGQFGWGAIPDSAFVDPPTPPAGSVPAKPSGLTATAASFKKINLSWSDNSNNEQSYEVYRSTDPMGSFTTIAVLPANTTSYADTTVEPATTYHYKIRAINQYGESPFDRIGQGLEYAYYEQNNMSVVPDFNLLTPQKTGRVNTFGLGMQMRPDDFALRFDGSINISSSGNYRFYLDSDDGSLLYIDGTLVVNNDGLHGSGIFNEKSGTVFLSAGSHLIRVSYFERGGSEVLNVKYGSNSLGITKQFIPASILGEAFASATTLSAPAPPLPPSDMTAVALSNSAIKVSWVNNAENATEVELYRSYNGDHDYVLFAKLPANTTSYNDNGLYPSSLFYYKVRSVGEGGSSLFSNEVNVRTLGVVPSMIPIEDVYIRYDAQVQLKVEAKSGTPVAITLQATNLPAFATFNQTQNGKGVITFNPTISDIGIYKNLKVTASNPQGNSNTTQFDLIVNENYPPHITPVANATVEEMGTLVVNLSATDSDPGDDLRWTFSKLPGFVTASSTNGGSLSLTFAPKNKTAGEYLIKVGVDDGRHGKDTTSFVLTVTPMPITNPDDGTVPIKPNNFTATFVNSLNGVKLEWTNAAYNAVKNEIYRSDYMGTGYVLLKEIAKDDTSYVDNSVDGNRIYYYLIRAVNANGGSNSLIVKVNIPNRAPFIIVDDIYAKAGTTLSVNVLATDDPQDIITLTALNLPSFITFSDNGDGTGLLYLSPDGSHVGKYNKVTIKASDQHGSNTSVKLNITVTDKYITSVFLNFNNKNYPFNAVPWNSFNVSHIGMSVPANSEVSNLRNELGDTTTISVKLLEQWSQHQDGLVTGNNSGLYPDSVLMTGFYLYVTQDNPQRTIRISGLNGDKRYNLVLFGNRSYSTPLITYYSVAGNTVSLDARNNVSNSVQINNLTPVNGSIDLVVSGPMKKYAPLNAMVIQEYDDGVVLPPYALKVAGTTKNSISISWKCEATDVTAFEVWRSTSLNGTYSKVSGTISGNTFSYTNTGLSSASVYYYKVRAVTATGNSEFSDPIGGATVKFAIDINFNEGVDGPPEPAPWNNVNTLITTGFTMNNLVNQDNQYTGIGMTVVNNFGGFNKNGPSTGNNSGVVPDNVMKCYYFMEYGTVAQLKITGLNQSMRYNFVFFGSRINNEVGYITSYAIGEEIVYLDWRDNTQNTVQINNVEPDELGNVNIFITCPTPGGYGYLNSLTIQAVTIPEGGGAPSGRKALESGKVSSADPGSPPSVLAASDEAVLLNAYPNPFVEDIVLDIVMKKPSPKVIVLLKDFSGRTLKETILSNVPSGTSLHHLNVNGRSLASGVYSIQVINPSDNMRSSSIRVVRN